MKLFRFYFVVLFFFILACSKKNKKNPYAVSIKPNETIQKLTPADLLDGFAVRFNSNYNPMESFSMEIDFFDAEAKCSPREGELDFSMNAANAYTVTISCDNLPQKSKGFLEMRLLSGGKKFLASAKMAYALDEIWTLNDFQMIPTIGLNKNYKQMQNIDGKNHQPISSIQKFSGEYNGNDYFFENVVVSATTEDKNHLGLFNEIEGTGTIMNWRLKNISLTRKSTSNPDAATGILVGKNEGKIYFVSVENSKLEDQSATTLGAFVGWNASNGEIYFCASKSNEIKDSRANNIKTAYFVGFNQDSIKANYSLANNKTNQKISGFSAATTTERIEYSYYKDESLTNVCVKKDFEGNENETCETAAWTDCIDNKPPCLYLYTFSKDKTINVPVRLLYGKEEYHTKYKEILQKAGKKPSTSTKVFKQDGTLFWE